MATEAQIKTEIEGVVSYHPWWRIGITDDPERRKREHNNPLRWYEWDAITETTARRIERYYIDEKGMQGDVGGGLTPHWVYIFYVGS